MKALSSLFIILLTLTLSIAQETQPTENKPTAEEVKKFLAEHNIEKLQFDGMYQGIEKLGPKTAELLIELLQSSEETVQFRSGVVLRALGDLGDKKAVAALKELKEDLFLEDQIKGDIDFILYRLGETEPLDKKFAVIINNVKNYHKNPPAEHAKDVVIKNLLGGYRQIAYFSYRMGKYKLSCEAYAEMLKLYPNASILYSYACSLSLSGQQDKAMEKLWEALKTKELHSAEMLAKDGDLRHLREREDFKELLKKLTSKIKENY